MANLAVAQRIGVPPEHVFAFFIPQRMPAWYGAEIDSAIDVFGCPNQFTVGSQVHIAGRVGKKPVQQNAVVTAFEYARLLEWRFKDPYGVSGVERWQLERETRPEGAATVVRFTTEYEIPGVLGRALDWLVTRHAVARRSREYLDRLARLAERRP